MSPNLPLSIATCQFTYIDCSGNTVQLTINDGDSIEICTKSIPVGVGCVVDWQDVGLCNLVNGVYVCGCQCWMVQVDESTTTTTSSGITTSTTTSSSGGLTFVCVDPTCDTAANGYITVNTTASGPFDYIFSQGPVTIEAKGITTNSWTQSGLTSGLWNFQVVSSGLTETGSCTLVKTLNGTMSSSGTIIQLVISGGYQNYWIGSVDSNGNYTGVFFDSGLVDGTYTWTLASGTYRFQIGDTDGCTQTFGPVTLPFTGPISVSIPLNLSNDTQRDITYESQLYQISCSVSYQDCTSGQQTSLPINSGEIIYICSPLRPVGVGCNLITTLLSGGCENPNCNITTTTTLQLCICYAVTGYEITSTTTTITCLCYTISINYTTTTTTLQNTTTTTSSQTLCLDCQFVDVVISATDLNNPNNFAQVVELRYFDCGGNSQTNYYGFGSTLTDTVCMCVDTNPEFIYFDDQYTQYTASNSTFTPTQRACTSQLSFDSILTAMPDNCTYTYTDCYGMTMSGTVNSGETIQVCSSSIPQGVDCTLNYSISGNCCVTTSTTSGSGTTTTTTATTSSNYYAIKMNDTNLIIGTPDEDVYINYAVCQGYTIYQMYDQWQITSLGDSSPADILKKQQLANFVKKIWDAGLKPVAIVGDGGTLPFDWVRNWEIAYLTPLTGTELWGINYENEFWNGSTSFTNWLSYLTYGKNLNPNWHTSAYMANGLSSSEANAFLLAGIDVVEATNYTTNTQSSPPYTPPNPNQFMFTSLIGSLNAEAVSMGMTPPYQQFVPLWSAEHPGYFLNNNFSGLYFQDNPPNFVVPLATWTSSFNAAAYPKMDFIGGLCMFDFNNLQDILPACLSQLSPQSLPGYYTVTFTDCYGGSGIITEQYGVEVFVCSSSYPQSSDAQLIVVDEGDCNSSPNCVTTTTTSCLCYILMARETTTTTLPITTTTTTGSGTTTTSTQIIGTTTTTGSGTTTTSTQIIGTTTTVSGTLSFTCVDPTCDLAANGYITVNTTASGPFDYIFTQGPVTIKATGIVNGTWTQSGLTSGLWNFQVVSPSLTETGSCTLVKTLNATMSSNGTIIELVIAGGYQNYWIASVDSNGNHTGVFFDSGLVDGTYTWTLASGTYRFQIGDTDGCTETFGPVTLPATGPISVSIPLNLSNGTQRNVQQVGICEITFTDCDGNIVNQTIPVDEYVYVCSSTVPTATGCSLEVMISGDCSVCFTTTTTTIPIGCGCFSISIPTGTTTTTTSGLTTTTTTQDCGCYSLQIDSLKTGTTTTTTTFSADCMIIDSVYINVNPEDYDNEIVYLIYYTCNGVQTNIPIFKSGVTEINECVSVLISTYYFYATINGALVYGPYLGTVNFGNSCSSVTSTTTYPIITTTTTDYIIITTTISV